MRTGGAAVTRQESRGFTRRCSPAAGQGQAMIRDPPRMIPQVKADKRMVTSPLLSPLLKLKIGNKF